YIAHVVFVSGGLIDDAYISFRYARNLAGGHGLVFNPGGARVEGYTNFSWVLAAALAAAAKLDAAALMPLVGIGCGLAAVVLAGAQARAIAAESGRPPRLAGLPAALVVAASPSLVFYAGSGMETSLFTLLLTGLGAS